VYRAVRDVSCTCQDGDDILDYSGDTFNFSWKWLPFFNTFLLVLRGKKVFCCKCKYLTEHNNMMYAFCIIFFPSWCCKEDFFSPTICFHI
jgi:hypothetical protein